MSVQPVNNVSVGSASSVKKALDIVNAKKMNAHIDEVVQRTSPQGHRERAKDLIHAFNHTDEVVFSRKDMDQSVGKLSELVKKGDKKRALAKAGKIGAVIVALIAVGLAVKHFVIDKKQAQKQEEKVETQRATA